MNKKPQKFIYIDDQKSIKINWGKYKIWPVITYIFYSIVVIFAIAALLGKFSIAGIRIFTVQSGSMEPAIKAGGLVIIKSITNYQVGDIITVKATENPKKTITHRIFQENIEDDNTRIFTTKGDANNAPDSDQITQGQIIGKAMFAIPYLGYAVGFARTLPGLIILIIIPATIIIYEEATQIRNVIRRRKIRRIPVLDISKK